MVASCASKTDAIAIFAAMNPDNELQVIKAAIIAIAAMLMALAYVAGSF